MSNLLTHALRELSAIEGKRYSEDERATVIQLISAFEGFDLSPYSKSKCLELFSILTNGDPLTPLTGADDEWEFRADGAWHNTRCMHVFKRENHFDGQAYDTCGRMFRRPDGTSYASSESFAPITFPYMPRPEYVNVLPEPVPLHLLRQKDAAAAAH